MNNNIMDPLELDISGNKFPITVVKIQVPDIKAPVGIRLDTTDIHAFEQVFISKDYEFEVPENFSPGLIIDGGANVGYSSIWFANRFPSSHLICVEPDESNFNFLKENMKPYTNIDLIKAALWHEKGDLEIVTHDREGNWLGHWGIQVKQSDESSASTIKATTINDIWENSDYEHIDILKLDVEGAEKEIFSANFEHWLNKTNIIILEIHERLKSECSQKVLAALKTADSDFLYFQKGENFIFTREHLITG
jgi:FkbM family methyltransferase